MLEPGIKINMGKLGILVVVCAVFYVTQSRPISDNDIPTQCETLPEPQMLAYYPYEKWDNGEIPYILHDSLNSSLTAAFHEAVNHLEKTTCIKLRPALQSDPDTVIIKYTNKLTCGEAEHCKLPGHSNYIKIGRKCSVSFKVAFLHEIGHLLCLAHTQQRADRDKHLKHPDGCPSKKKSINSAISEQLVYNGFYDVHSIMQYGCGCGVGTSKHSNITKCGMQKGKGYSILDRNSINMLYNCSNCFRDRWYHVSQFADNQIPFFFFGIQVCRVMLNDELILGTYYNSTCIIDDGSKYIHEKDNFEIFFIATKNTDVNRSTVSFWSNAVQNALRIFGYSVRREHSIYGLATLHRNMSRETVSALFEISVQAGHNLLTDSLENGIASIGFITLRQNNCDNNTLPFSGTLGAVAYTVNVLQDNKGSFSASILICGQRVELTYLQLLVCTSKVKDLNDRIKFGEGVRFTDLTQRHSITGISNGSTLILQLYTLKDYSKLIVDIISNNATIRVKGIGEITEESTSIKFQSNGAWKPKKTIRLSHVFQEATSFTMSFQFIDNDVIDIYCNDIKLVRYNTFFPSATISKLLVGGDVILENFFVKM